MSAPFHEFHSGLPWYVQPAIWHVTVDQNWAVNIAEYRRGTSRHLHPLTGRVHAWPVRDRRRGGLGAMGPGSAECRQC